MTEPITKVLVPHHEEGKPFLNSLQHLLAELERIDLLVQVQVWRGRQTQGSDDEFQGLYISENEVDVLLAEPAGLPRWATASLPVSSTQVQETLQRIAAAIRSREAQSQELGINLRLTQLSRIFQLSQFELDALLICLAPEIDLRYERLYAYLQDDVTKKRPSVDLVLNLLCNSLEGKLRNRQHFTDGSSLIKHNLLNLIADPSQQPTLLSRFLKVDERIASFLLDSNGLDSNILPYAELFQPEQSSRKSIDDLILPDELKRRLGSLANMKPGLTNGLVMYLQGPYGVGKQTIAEAMCLDLGLPLLVVNGEKLLPDREGQFGHLVSSVGREALLQGAAIYWQGFDLLLEEAKQPMLQILLQSLGSRRGLTFLSGNTVWEPSDALQDVPFLRIEVPRPSAEQRAQLWAKSLNGHTPQVPDLDLSALTTKFRFSGGQIRDAANTAQNLARWRDPEREQVSTEDLNTAARLQSNRRLAAIAQKITPHYQWDDIVLPPDRLQQLREICNYVKYSALVYQQWGFDGKLSMGKGLNALFAGPSGTGKTMAAEIIAGELGLDMYKIDLSGVISKFIGETEKNLAHIFTEAETSNAILFFDEADALFGKRSEVRDSHDRYANIEISYLLQRMEEYDGVVILATNLRKNMDDAFVRRIHFSVDFPFPAERERKRIWNAIWPENIPRSNALDLEFMARRFEMAGGNIRNVALAAAFLAADDGEVVTMSHLIHGMRREYQKMGKVIVDGEFGEYASLAHN